MTLNIQSQARRMRGMSMRELKALYVELFGEEARSNNRDYLVKRNCWRLQAREEGDLPERARRRALEIADDADLRRGAPKEAMTSASVSSMARSVAAAVRMHRPGMPRAGTTLVREYKGRRVEVRVLDRGFEFDGRMYRSLTAIARELTGSNWNGRHFFGLKNSGGGQG